MRKATSASNKKYDMTSYMILLQNFMVRSANSKGAKEQGTLAEGTE